MASLRPGIHQGILGKKEFQLQGVKFLLQRGCLVRRHKGGKKCEFKILEKVGLI